MNLLNRKNNFYWKIKSNKIVLFALDLHSRYLLSNIYLLIGQRQVKYWSCQIDENTKTSLNRAINNTSNIRISKYDTIKT